MPLSADSPNDDDEIPGLTLAIWAESLYLSNLLLAPGVCFAALLWLYYRRPDAPALGRCHLKQAISASVWAGILLGVITAILLTLNDLHSEATWLVVIIYLTCFHSTLVLLGIFGLSKALAGQSYVYPLIGRPCE
ncbi:MAG: hypothetical protein KGZ83_12600 [Sulfuricella sp.]|nr:hypothetical protein [Sulfuricella sp.]